MRAVIAVIVLGLLATAAVSGELPARVEHVAKQARSRFVTPRSLFAAFLAPRHDVAWTNCDGDHRCSQLGPIIPTRLDLVTHGRPGIRILCRPHEHPRLAALP